MKLNKKVIIPAFTLLVGTALAGSVSSTVAWYQYSTKANVAYIGASAGTIGNLKVRIYEGGEQAATDGWKTSLSYNDVNTFLNSKKIQPITTGAMGKNDKLKKFYSNPVAGYGPLDKWNEADATNYVQIPLQFKFVEKDGSVDNENHEIETLVAKELHLSDLLIQNDYSNAAAQKRDLSSAIRVHFEGYVDGAESTAHVYRLASKDGEDTLTVGNLDLDGDGKPDKTYSEAQKEVMYGFGGYDSSELENMGTVINYGEVLNQTNNNQESYSSSEILDINLGTTSTVADKFLNVVVTIWLEGWQQLPKTSDTDQNVSSIWDYLSTINSNFDVGMQFEAK